MTEEKKRSKWVPWLVVAVVILAWELFVKVDPHETEPTVIHKTEYITKVVKPEPVYVPPIETPKPTPVPTPVIVQPKEPERCLVIWKTTPVYTGDSVASEQIGYLRSGDTVTINNGGRQLFEKSLWVPVLVDGMPGYIHEGYIQMGRR